MFKKIFNTTNIQDELKTSQIKLHQLQQKLAIWEQKASEIQLKFDFYLPDYIIDEIIENEDSKNFLNLYYLINCAVANERISESNAELLKQTYSFK